MGLSIAQLVTALGTDPQVDLVQLVGDSTLRAIRIQVVEELDQTDEVKPGTVAFLSKHASLQAVDYHLDVTIRRLKDAAAVFIQSICERPSPTGLTLAKKMGIPIVRFLSPVDFGEIITRTALLINGDTHAVLDLTAQLIDGIEGAVNRSTTPGDILETLGENRFGIRLGPRDERLLGVPAVVTEPEGAWFQREPTTPVENLLAELLSWRIAGSVTRETIERDRANELSILSAGAILDQLLSVVDEDDLQRLTRRARAIGLPIDGWHEAVCFEFANLLTLCGEDPVSAYGQNQNLAQLAMQTASRLGGRWALTIRPAGPTLIRTRSRPRSPSESRAIVAQMTEVIEALRDRMPRLNILCGIGSSHEGVRGMSATEAEATTAIQTAQLRATVNVPTVFDSPGIRRLLVEWYASRTVRESVNDLLSPLGELQSQSKQRDYLNTLRVYLDSNRSVSRAAETLFVHRNTVLYRINKIVELLDVDLDDPHQALALHLACHAEMAMHPSFNAH